MDLNDQQKKIVHETARINWHELQKFFAAGNAINIDSSLDLIDIAAKISNDDSESIAPLTQKGLVGPVDDEQAKKWYDTNQELWAVVIAPWVLVQDKAKRG